MTELQLRQEAHLPDVTMGRSFARLAEWAESARAAHQVATSLVKTSFVPEAFRGKAEEATAAILAGAEIGLDPMASLRSFDIIQGTAAPRANTLRAVVQAAGHDINLIESTDTRAIVEGRRRGASKPQRSVWTIERATKLGLTGKHNWKAQPQAMLVARATAECARLIASDAILGIPYAAEELDDDITASPVATESKPPRKTAQRALKAVVEPTPAPEPSFDDAPKPSREQMNLMFALFGKVGPDDRDDRLAYISNLLDRTVTSSSDLTPAEVSVVIDDLKAQEVVKNLAAEPTFDDDWPETAEPVA